MANETCAVVLAAGDGRRMKSAKPKALCEVLFKPMVAWVAEGILRAGMKNACVIVREDCRSELEAALPESFVTIQQTFDKIPGYGTGHAAMMAEEYIKKGGYRHVVILCGDAPFVSGDDISNAYSRHVFAGNDVTILTAKVENPTGYGRIVRAGENVAAIVEQNDADEQTRRINEINSGALWFRADFLLEGLKNLSRDNAKGEYYLTDTVSWAAKNGFRAGACEVSPDAVLGANDRKGLAALNKIALEKILDYHMANGACIPFPDRVVIGADVVIGTDATILPGTVLKGLTVIGKDCIIGPNSYLENAAIGDGCKIVSSHIESVSVESGAQIGPMKVIKR